MCLNKKTRKSVCWKEVFLEYRAALKIGISEVADYQNI